MQVSNVYSHSRLACFENCPRQFHYRYVRKLPPAWESIEAFVGKRVHEVLERLQVFVGSGRVPTLAAVLRRYRQLWEEQFDEHRVRVVRDERPPVHYREFGERCLTNHYRGQYPFDGEETLGLEERVTVDLGDDGRYRLQGFVDRIARARDDAIEIHDYKTSRRMPRQERLDADRQLALYQLGVAPRFPGTSRFRLVWHFLCFGQVRVSTRTERELDELRQRVVELIDRIEREQSFEARPGPLCPWCEYRELCPASPFHDGALAARAEDPAERPAAAPEPPAPTPASDDQLALFRGPRPPGGAPE